MNGSELCKLPKRRGFFYKYHAGFIFILGVSLPHPVLVSHLSGEFSYTSHTGFPFLWGVSLTLPVLLRFCFVFVYFFDFVLSGEFLLDIPYWFLLLSFFFPSFLYIFYRGKFPYISRAGFIFIWGVSLNRLMLASFLSWEFLLHIPCWLYFSVVSFSYTSKAGLFLFIVYFFKHFNRVSFSYTSRAGFILSG